jgi:magnesium transporter
MGRQQFHRQASADLWKFAISTATLAAMLLPWLFSICGRDPAFGSGPLATVIQDLLSILIYFAIAAAVVR